MKVLLPLLSLTLIAGCSRPPAAGPIQDRAAVPVHTAKVLSLETPQTLALSGIVRPHERATIAAKVVGAVASDRLVLGRMVSAQEVLVTIQAPEFQARLEQARATVAQAERDHARETELERKGASTTESVRAAQDRLRIAQAALQEAVAMLDYLQITAPFAGVITGDFINPGDLVSPGQPLFELEGADQFRAEVLVPESLSQLAIGTTLAVEWDRGASEGRLVELSPAADPLSRSRQAKIELSSTAVHSGQFVRVLWPAGTHTALVVPTSSISIFGQMERVYVVNAGRAHLRIIKTGATVGEHTQILSGLEPGETVIASPSATLVDGQPVNVTP